MFAITQIKEKVQNASSAVSSVFSSAANTATNAVTSAANAATSGIKNLGFETEHDDHPDNEHNAYFEETVESVPKEEAFISAIENGDIGVFLEMLYRKEELELDIDNIKDTNGLTPLRLAIVRGYSGIVGQLLKHGVHVGDALLRAVDVGFLETVKIICEYADTLQSGVDRLAILDCHCDDDDYHPDVTPIVLASQQNDFGIVKVLTEAGCKIKSISTRPMAKKIKNRRSSMRASKATDDLQKSVGSLEVYRGLTSEAYLIQGNEDPIEAAFTLSKKLRDLGQKDVEFKPSYVELANQVDQVGTELISYARSTEEVLSILTFSDRADIKKDEPETNMGPLPKISKAMEFKQKSFVAHTNCQQAVLAKFYGQQAFLRDHSSTYKFLYLLLLILGFPFLSLAYLYLPMQRVKKFLKCPYTKFTLKLASDLYFIVLLTADAIVHPSITDHLTLETPTKALLLIWILGIAWREMKVINRHGASSLKDSGHLRDILLVSLFLIGITLDLINHIGYIERLETKEETSYLRSAFDLKDQRQSVLHRGPRAAIARTGGTTFTTYNSDPITYTNEDHQAFVELEWWQPKLIASAMFALSTVMSFLRMLQYFVVSDVLGPFQISLGTMVAKTANFFVVVGIVLLSFAVGLTSLYDYYMEIDSLTCGGSDSVPCTKDRFSNLENSILFLFWSAMGVEDNQPLHLENQAVVIENAGLTLYAMFYVLMVIVLLNALIAVMSEAYNTVEENADVEWKFHSTAMWMSILLDDDVLPPPFNLLPSIEGIKAYLTTTEYSYEDKKKAWQESIEKHSRSKALYKRVINKLVERYVTAKTKDDISVSAEVTMTDILGLKNDLQLIKLEIFQRLFETTHHVNQIADVGTAIEVTLERATKVLNKAGDLHEEVDMALIATNEFKTHVLSQQMIINKEIKDIEKQISSQGFLTKFVDSFVTTRTPEKAVLSPTMREAIVDIDSSPLNHETYDNIDLNSVKNHEHTTGSSANILHPQPEELRDFAGVVEHHRENNEMDKDTEDVQSLPENKEKSFVRNTEDTDMCTASYSKLLAQNGYGATDVIDKQNKRGFVPKPKHLNRRGARKVHTYINERPEELVVIAVNEVPAEVKLTDATVEDITPSASDTDIFSTLFEDITPSASDTDIFSTLFNSLLTSGSSGTTYGSAVARVSDTYTILEETNLKLSDNAELSGKNQEVFPATVYSNNDTKNSIERCAQVDDEVTGTNFQISKQTVSLDDWYIISQESPLSDLSNEHFAHAPQHAIKDNNECDAYETKGKTSNKTVTFLTDFLEFPDVQPSPENKEKSCVGGDEEMDTCSASSSESLAKNGYGATYVKNKHKKKGFVSNLKHLNRRGPRKPKTSSTNILDPQPDELGGVVVNEVPGVLKLTSDVLTGAIGFLPKDTDAAVEDITPSDMSDEHVAIAPQSSVSDNNESDAYETTGKPINKKFKEHLCANILDPQPDELGGVVVNEIPGVLKLTSDVLIGAIGFPPKDADATVEDITPSDMSDEHVAIAPQSSVSDNNESDANKTTGKTNNKKFKEHLCASILDPQPDELGGVVVNEVPGVLKLTSDVLTGAIGFPPKVTDAAVEDTTPSDMSDEHVAIAPQSSVSDNNESDANETTGKTNNKKGTSSANILDPQPDELGGVVVVNEVPGVLKLMSNVLTGAIGFPPKDADAAVEDITPSDMSDEHVAIAPRSSVSDNNESDANETTGKTNNKKRTSTANILDPQPDELGGVVVNEVPGVLKLTSDVLTGAIGFPPKVTDAAVEEITPSDMPDEHVAIAPQSSVSDNNESDANKTTGKNNNKKGTFLTGFLKFAKKSKEEDDEAINTNGVVEHHERNDELDKNTDDVQSLPENKETSFVRNTEETDMCTASYSESLVRNGYGATDVKYKQNKKGFLTNLKDLNRREPSKPKTAKKKKLRKHKKRQRVKKTQVLSKVSNLI